MIPADDDRDGAGIPCAFGMLAATMALMTGHAAPEPGARVDADTLRRLTARKVVSNLFFLRQHPALPPGMRRVLDRLHGQWLPLAQPDAASAAMPVHPRGDLGVLH